MTKAMELYQKIGALLTELPEKGTSENYDQAIYGLVMAMDALVREDDPEFRGTSFPIWIVDNKETGMRGVYQQEASAQYTARQFGNDAVLRRGWAVTDEDISVDEDEEHLSGRTA